MTFGWLGLTELGDIVGQASEACSRDENANGTTTRVGESRTERAFMWRDVPFVR